MTPEELGKLAPLLKKREEEITALHRKYLAAMGFPGAVSTFAPVESLGKADEWAARAARKERWLSQLFDASEAASPNSSITRAMMREALGLQRFVFEEDQEEQP